MSTLTTTLAAEIRALMRGSSDHGAPQSDEDLSFAAALADGTGNSQANALFSDQRTLAASANETLDLTALTDPLGVAVAFTKVKAILIKAAAGNTNDVVVGAAATFPFLGSLGGTAPTRTIKPGGMEMFANPVSGWAVVDGVNDNLKIANSGGTTGVTYDIVIVGTQ